MDREFPPCATPGCANTGTMRCEFVTGGTACRTAACARHGHRWQVFGPDRAGLALCHGHAQLLASLKPEQVLDAVVASTANRKRTRLPTLGSFRHILINTCRTVRPVTEVKAMLVALQSHYRQAGMTAKLDILMEASRSWSTQVDVDAERQARGRSLFDKALAAWVVVSPPDAVSQLQFSDYREPKAGGAILFVRAPATIRGRLIGRQGAALKQVEATLARSVPGLRIKFEADA
jgi:hypothetical protein